MKTLAALLLFVSALLTSGGPETEQVQEIGPETGRISTPARIHNVLPAHEVTLGKGAKVGILDHSFGVDAHPGLYAGRKVFRVRKTDPEPAREAHQGYWMAVALHEIAPAASIFALDLLADDEADRVQLITQAMIWSVENGLDVITYCAGGLSQEARDSLDPILEQTVKAGVVVVFVDYPHSLNLSPAVFGAMEGTGEQAPDLKVFSYDCTTLMADQFMALVVSDDDEISRNRPFLARPAIGSVTAGLVALVRSVDPEAHPIAVKKLLVETSRPVEIRGTVEQNVPDALAAVSKISG